MTKTENEQEAVSVCVAHHPDPSKIRLADMEGEILKETNTRFGIHNGACQKDEKWPKRHVISNAQAAALLLLVFHIRTIKLCPDAVNQENKILGIYDPETGIYETDESFIRSRIYEINRNFSQKDVADILQKVSDWAPSVERTLDRELVPVNNGIFDYKNKKLLPFSPDYVYLTKCPVDYVPNTVSPVIHNAEDGTDWEIEEWMRSLSDDPEIVELLWEITGACIRPGVSWNKVVWLYSTSGNSGKGTLCSLMRNLCGAGNHVSISLNEFDGNPFLLSGLIHASAVIADENNVGLYIDKSKNLKAAATGDMLYIDRKYKDPVTYRYKGIIIECMNELPRIRDKSGSYARRQLLVPFDKCFTGAEREYIKEDYLSRKDVLEYVLWRILSSSYYKFSSPAACEGLLEEYKSANNPVRDFAEQILPELVWDLVPFTFLYALYKEWFKRNNPSGTILSARSFTDDLLETLKDEDLGYECQDKRRKIKTNGKMDKPEPLIMEYGLADWMNQTYKGNDPQRLCVPFPLKINDRGLTRK